MVDPALGFVEGGYDDPVKTGLDRPFLNARQQYTHIVDDGATKIVGGGIECALDGGTVGIAAYDVTDGVEGAPRVFKQEVQLPERPKSDADGYEFDTYTFDLNPVRLYDYAGRELAVAVRHPHVRLRGTNWSDDFRAEEGWGYSSGNREDPLFETWQDSLQASGSIISAALFVEPVATPDGRAKTVIGSDVFADISRTVFAAFPDLPPEQGTVVEYVEQTAAGAPVRVLENGVLEVGQGSTETDSVDVWVRETDGTWHGPRTITFTEGTETPTVTARGGTISPGEQLSPSLTAGSVETLTLEQLWVDWTVEVEDPAGGTVRNRVSESGEMTLEWDSVQSEISPLISITPPADTYVGGTYAVDVVGEGGGTSAADTLFLDIQSSTGDAADGHPHVSTENQTTIVATRAPDGSRLTSRPDGPVHQTTDGTVHLFTWDQPGPGARAVLYDDDDSTDWSQGPDVHIYDTFERPDATAGDVPRRLATRGKWDHYRRLPEIRSNSHSGAFSARIQNQDAINKFKTTFPETTEVFLSYCVKIPEGKAMPGTEQAGEFPEASVWKMSWLYNEDVGASDDDVDIVLPTWNGGGVSLGGNNLVVDVDIHDSKYPDWWQWGEWMRFSFWLECGPDPAEDPGRVRWQVVTEGEQTQVVADGQDKIMADGQPPYTWKRLDIPGWAQNKNVSGDNVEALYDDIYLATGEDANARVELSDSVEYGSSSRIQLCDIESWTSNRVSARLRKGSLDSVESAVIHLTTADEQQAVSMEVN